jgi:hypothetical protein
MQSARRRLETEKSGGLAMTAGALRGSDDRASDRILRATFWSTSVSERFATVIALSSARPAPIR